MPSAFSPVRTVLFRLHWALGLTAGLVLVAGIALGVALYTPLSSRRIGDIPLRFSPTAVIVWACVLFGLGLLSTLFSARRVLAIDPIEATSAGGTGL